MEGSFISLPVYAYDEAKDLEIKKRVRININNISSIEPNTTEGAPGRTEIEMATGTTYYTDTRIEDFDYLARITTYIL